MSRLQAKAHKLFRAAQDFNLKWYVEGPCNGMGRNDGTLRPESRLPSKEAAESAAELCVSAYQQGVEDALKEVREVLGLTK